VSRAPFRSALAEVVEGSSVEATATRRPGAGIAAIVAGLVAASVVVWFVQRHSPVPVQVHTGEVGSIVYAARTADGQTRLYRWDLIADVVHRGPVVRNLIGLYDASAAHPGWVGESSSSPTGGVDVGVFKFLGPDDEALPLGHGAVVGWAARGADVAVGTLIHQVGGCGQLHILLIHVATRRHETAGDEDERVCATLDAVAQGQTLTFLSLGAGPDPRIVHTSEGRLRPVLDRAHLESLSPADDLIVTPASSSPSSQSQAAALYFQGPPSQTATPYMLGGSPFVLDRVLAWAPDGSEALALGSSGGRTGFFRLEAAPPEGPTQPAVYVGPAIGYANALYTATTRMVFSDGHFSRVLDGSTTTFPLPPGAPVPTGPMVWVRS
jgi:hypothetical protein